MAKHQRQRKINKTEPKAKRTEHIPATMKGYTACEELTLPESEVFTQQLLSPSLFQVQKSPPTVEKQRFAQAWRVLTLS